MFFLIMDGFIFYVKKHECISLLLEISVNQMKAKHKASYTIFNSKEMFIGSFKIQRFDA